ncbi:MAG: molybdopterin converting factor subunit 1 [Cyanobacteria bacterium LVE1205-1]|jgi:molybdopterin converting factor subunit 1
MKKSVTLRYFASLAEQTQLTHEQLETELLTYGELYHWLAHRYQFTLPLSQIRVAVNDEFTPMEYPIQPQDRIVFIPPVSGG